MDKKDKNRFEKFLAGYFKEIHKIYTDRAFREEILKRRKSVFQKAYWSVNWDIVWDVIRNQIPKLKEKIGNRLDNVESEKA